MPKGYVVFTEAIRDRAALKDYFAKSAPTFAEHGGSVMIVDDHPDVVEGEWHGNRTVVLEFDSVDAARAWYHSEGYQAAAAIRQAAADCNVVILSGFTPR